MPKIIVISESKGSEGTVTLEERVVAAHLEDHHSAAQLVERVGWAILDAEEAERASIQSRLSPSRRPLVTEIPRRRGPAVAA
jgi:hypothetical protein